MQWPNEPFLQLDPRTKYILHEDRLLGSGRFGRVFHATTRDGNVQVACKAIAKRPGDSALAELHLEVNVHRALDSHPNVATLYEVFEDASHVYLMMEPCLGGEVFDFIVEQGQLREAEAAKIARVVLSVVRHCHAHDVVHRDIKPENLLRKYKRQGDGIVESEIRAIDFGLSLHVGEGERLSQMVGSSYYVAPEVLIPSVSYSYEVDLWSSGVLLYILLSGMPPFWGHTEDEIFQRVLYEPLDLVSAPWQRVSDSAKDLVAALLQRDPAQRISAAAAMVHPWITSDCAARSETNLMSPQVLTNLTAFTTAAKFKQLILQVVAKHMDGEQIADLARTFQALDVDRSGSITPQQLMQACTAVQADCPVSCEGMLAALDLSKDGRIRYEEFLAAALSMREVFTLDRTAGIFRLIDSNRDGVITIPELQAVLQSCHVPVDAAALGEVLEAAGAERGQLTLRQFQQLCLPHDADGVLDGAALQALLASLVAAGAGRDTEPRMRQVFDALDSDRDGVIANAELQAVLSDFEAPLQRARSMLSNVGEEEEALGFEQFRAVITGDPPPRDLIQCMDLAWQGVI